MRRRTGQTWIVVGAAVLRAAGLGLRGGPDRTSAEPEAPKAWAGDRIEGAVTHVRDGDTVELAGVAVRIANLGCAERDTAEGRGPGRLGADARACRRPGRRLRAGGAAEL